MKLFLKIDKHIEIWQDQFNFIVRFKKGKEYLTKKNWYLSSFDSALSEAIDELLKTSKVKPEIEEIKKLLFKIKQDILTTNAK